MNFKFTILAVTILLLISSIPLTAQRNSENAPSEESDRVTKAREKEQKREQAEIDKQRMDAAKDAKKESKAKAKEADRLEKDAKNAAHESKLALRS
jgi:hypothetical protein